MHHADEIGALERTANNQHRHIGHAQGVFELEKPVSRVDVDQQRPHACRGELGHHPLGRVHRPDPDVLAAHDPSAISALAT